MTESEPSRKNATRWIRAPWFWPIWIVLVFGLFRMLFPNVSERPELFLLDQTLRARAAAGFAEPLDSSIHFVEFAMDREIGARFAEKGEYTTAADILRAIASERPKVIVVDIIYTWGRREDQEALAKALAEIEAQGVRVVLPVSIEQAGLLRSLPDTEAARHPVGVVNVRADNRWREYQFVHRFREETIPSLALAAFGAGRSHVAPSISSPGVISWKTVREGEIHESKADTSRLFLNLQHSYYHQSLGADELETNRVWTIPQIEALAKTESAASPLFGATVFFGYDADLDGKPTTHGPREPGMLLHATALNDLLKDQSIRKAPPWLDLILFALAAGLAGLLFGLVKKKRWILPLSLLGFFGLAGLGALSIVKWCVLPGAANAAFVWAAVCLVETLRRWAVEERERLHRDAMLGFYFSPAILKQVTKDLGMIDPKGAEVAVLLSDLRGFTNLCETQDVKRVFELLNRLFAVETEAALAEGGSLSRFAGDQFLAYWGAPEPYTDSADRALRAALEIQRTLRARIAAADSGDLDSWLRIGVGLHYGSGLVGHVGSRSYRDYNIVGDSVNTTARVEGQTKNYAAPILATGRFMEALSEKPDALKVDVVQVKGKAQATELHAVFLEYDGAVEESSALYQSALAQYQVGEFSEAAEQFSGLEKSHNETIATSAGLLRARCQELAASPPKKWGGVYELKSK